MKIKTIIIFLLMIISSSTTADTALITTGGVSLGIYEAGFLHYAIREANRNKNGEKSNAPAILSGASAGAINSFVAILEGCSPSAKHPSDSLFWKVWLPLSVDKFSLTKDEKSLSLFSRKSLDDIFQTLRNKWKDGLTKGCASYLGITVTRKEPLHFLKNSSLDFPRVREFFTLKITGLGLGVPPRVENFNLMDNSVQAQLPFTTNQIDNFELIKNVLTASGSFPLAFEATALKHCLVKLNKFAKCNETNLREDLFIDGGVFNNAPIDVAYRIAKSLKREKTTQFIIFDPEIKNYPNHSDSEMSNLNPGIMKEALTFTKNFVTSSRKGQISQFLSNHPELEKKISVIKGSLPLMGEPLAGFFGFFEREFRIFDFNIGIFDAINSFGEQQEIKKLTKENFQNLHESWKIPACLIAGFDKNTEVMAECARLEKKGESNFKKLFNVSIERLINKCRSSKDQKRIENKICNEIKTGKNPNFFISRHDDEWIKKKNEADLPYIIRRLSFYNFEFKDLGLKANESKLAPFKIKEKMVSLIKRASKNQHKDERFLLKQFASPMMNYLLYVPRPKETFILLGNNSFEFGQTHVYKYQILKSSFIRYGYGVMLTGTDTILSEDKDSVIGINPYIAFYLEPTWLAGPLRYTNIGFRIGHQFSSKTNFKINSCQIQNKFHDEFPNCTSWTPQLSISTTFLESLKLQAVFQWMPFESQLRKTPRYFTFLIGWQF